MLNKLALALLVGMAGLFAFQPYPHAFPRQGTTKLFENDRVAVWKAIWPTGVQQPFHQHRYDMAAVYLRYGRIAVTTLDGKAVNPPHYDVPWPYFQEKGRLHKEEATSGTEQLAVMIDLKDTRVGPWKAPKGLEPSFPRVGAKDVLDNPRVRMWDYTWQANKLVSQHVHDKDSIEVFFEGGALMTTMNGGKQDTATFRFADARFVPRGRIDSEVAVLGSPRAIIVELK
jgi:hypothetical protein